MYLIASPALTEEDVAALDRGYTARDLHSVASRTIRDIEDSLTRDRLGALEWLVREGALEVSLAVPVGPTGRPRVGIYHEKIGIFEDPHHSQVGFVGSSNETTGGLVSNFESIQVFWSWEDAHARVAGLNDDFERLWNDDTPGLRVFPFTSAVADLLKPFAVRERSAIGVRDREDEGPPAPDLELPRLPTVPAGLVLAAHQRSAVDAWIENKGRGICAMATGAGKTITAISCIHEVFRRAKTPVCAIVVVPFLVLADQWCAELRRWRIEPILCAYSLSQWEPRSRAEIAGLRGTGRFTCFVVTNTTFASPGFQSILKDLPAVSMLVADEVHNLGAARLRACLPERIPYRIGLSATPERRHDASGTDALTAYFGRQISAFTIRDALSADPPVLSPYDYWPVPVEFDTDEAGEYLDISTRIGRLLNKGGNEDDPSEALLWLLLRRSRLIGAARGKLAALVDAIRPYKGMTQSLVYCGDGSSELADPAEGEGEEEQQEPLIRQVDAVAIALTERLGMRVATYTSRTSAAERVLRMRDFAAGRIQALVAIRCLDEGVDMPDVRRAFILASSTNPRQYVQRRGRVLRRSPGKTHAEIFDFVVVPPDLEDISEDPAVRRQLRGLVEREFERVVEFASTARNTHQARAALGPVLKRLQLEHL